MSCLEFQFHFEKQKQGTESTRYLFVGFADLAPYDLFLFEIEIELNLK